VSEKPEKSDRAEKEKKGAAKRRHPRVEMELPGELFEGVGGKTTHHVTVGNLGPEGAFVKADAKIDQGAKVRIVFRISNHALPLDIDGEVRWARDGAGGGLGVHFTTCPAFERSAIDDFCQQRIEDARGGAAGAGD